jgi:phosphate transport system substrate-binding protein
MAPLITHNAQRYRKLHRGVIVEVRGVGSRRGIMDTRNGLNSIGMISRDIRSEAGDLTQFPIARDGICFIVSGDNGVKNLSARQLAAIFSGRVSNWKEVGGRDAPIVVILRDAGRSSTKIVSEFLSLPVADLHGVVIPAESQVTVRTVGNNRNAISYVSFTEATRFIIKGESVRIVPVDGVLPNRTTIDRGSYPLARGLHLVVKGKPTRLARDFIRFATSGEVADIIVADGFAPLAAAQR